MARYNRFYSTVTCRHCGTIVNAWFQADMGTLRWDDFRIGDQVFFQTTSPDPPYGPSDACDFSRNFWATGLGTCPMCRSEMRVRVVIREGHFLEVIWPDTPDSDDDWGYLDSKS